MSELSLSSRVTFRIFIKLKIARLKATETCKQAKQSPCLGIMQQQQATDAMKLRVQGSRIKMSIGHQFYCFYFNLYFQQ